MLASMGETAVRHSRRGFVARATGAVAFGKIGSLFSGISCNAAELDVRPELVQLTPDIEPIVRLIENTPRERCFEMMLGQLKAGLTYRQFVAALFLAGIRNVRPHPLGFKFHCVLAIHAAHQLSLDAPVRDRLLPMFWMLNEFKVSQQRDVSEGDYQMPPLRGPLPSPARAWKEFHAAMEAWDEPRADRAITALVRSRGAHEVIEGLWRYGARDYRNIGHKPIYVAGAWRVLQTIGWQHAEPVLRSVAMGMTDFGPTQRVNRYGFEDQCYLPNLERIEATGTLPGDWTAGDTDAALTQDLLDVMRGGDSNAACSHAIKLLAQGTTQAPSLWDAVHLMAAELMARQPGIYGIHTVTSANALHTAYRESSSSETRLLMLLQATGWMCQFHTFMSQANDGLNDIKITSLPTIDIPSDTHESLEDIFADIGKAANDAANKTFAFASQHDTSPFFSHARKQILQKTREVHGLKYPVAIFEDTQLVSPRWRPHLLAASTYYLPGSNQPDSPVMQKAREAISGLS